MKRIACLLLVSGCGLNVGLAPAQRVFPNPPSLGALESAPAYRPEPPPACAVDLGDRVVDRVDLETSSPWGAFVGDSGAGVYLPDEKLVADMQHRVADTMSSCPGFRRLFGQSRRHLRFVIEHVEAEVITEASQRREMARVTLRVEKYDDAYDGLATFRVDGALSATPETEVRELVLAALDRGLGTVLASEFVRTP